MESQAEATRAAVSKSQVNPQGETCLRRRMCMRKRLVFLALGLASLLGGGCSTSKVAPAAPLERTQVGANSFVLLYQLLEQEKNVSKLLLVKRERVELKRLIKKISSASAQGAKTLEKFAKQDGGLPLKQSSLPAGEMATREAIAATRTKELLSASGDEFEVSLLMTQSEALTYAWHLAKVASANDPLPARARYLSGLGEEMKTLQAQVVSMLRSRRLPPRP